MYIITLEFNECDVDSYLDCYSEDVAMALDSIGLDVSMDCDIDYELKLGQLRIPFETRQQELGFWESFKTQGAYRNLVKIGEKDVETYLKEITKK